MRVYELGTNEQSFPSDRLLFFCLLFRVFKSSEMRWAGCSVRWISLGGCRSKPFRPCELHGLKGAKRNQNHQNQLKAAEMSGIRMKYHRSVDSIQSLPTPHADPSLVQAAYGHKMCAPTCTGQTIKQ